MDVCHAGQAGTGTGSNGAAATSTHHESTFAAILDSEREPRHAASRTSPQKERPMTKLDKPLRREIAVGDQAYTLTIDPDGLKLVPKGHRNGVSLSWKDLVSGDAAIASALQASAH
jgi:hypothetical protein